MQFTDSASFTSFLLAGKAIFTLRSKKTGVRFTYKVSKGRAEDAPWFVGVLSGPDNNAEYQYIGFLPRDGFTKLVAGRKGKPEAPSFKALSWALNAAGRSEQLPEQLEVWHEGRCGRCGRRLTVPESIETGLGPECANKMAA